MIIGLEDLQKVVGKITGEFDRVTHTVGGLAYHGKSAPSAPSPPDPVATAEAQASANREANIATVETNMINQNTPYGSLSYTERGDSAQGNPQYTATQTLAPDQQAMLDLTNRAGIQYGLTANDQLDAVRNKLSSPLDFGQLGPAPQANEDIRKSVSDSMYARMEPLMNRDRTQLETRLANQGIELNSQAYNDAMDTEARARNDTRLAIDQSALGQMSQLYGLESAVRDKAVNELSTERSQPLNELSAMLSGSAVQGPQFVNAPQGQVSPSDIMGATYANYNGQMDAWKQQQANNNAMMGGLFGLAGSGAGAYGTYAGLKAAAA
jgi:hypothetical protein